MTNLALVKQCCSMLDAQLTEARGLTERPHIEAVFLSALTWSLGGALVQPARATTTTAATTTAAFTAAAAAALTRAPPNRRASRSTASSRSSLACP